MSARDLAARFGWTSLSLWACAGLALEAMHGFKVALYLDDELTRTLLRLSHAHGVGLSIVVLVFGASAAPRLAPELASHLGRALAFAAGALPIGFALGAVAHPEGDPSIGIALVPIGALALLYALGRTTIAMWRAPSRPE
jgi:hypothetical protein